MVHTIRHSGSI